MLVISRFCLLALWAGASIGLAAEPANPTNPPDQKSPSKALTPCQKAHGFLKDLDQRFEEAFKHGDSADGLGKKVFGQEVLTSEESSRFKEESMDLADSLSDAVKAINEIDRLISNANQVGSKKDLQKSIDADIFHLGTATFAESFQKFYGFLGERRKVSLACESTDKEQADESLIECQNNAFYPVYKFSNPGQKTATEKYAEFKKAMNGSQGLSNFKVYVDKTLCQGVPLEKTVQDLQGCE